MSCNNPFTIKVKGETYQVPCRECMGCRIQNRNSWITRIRYEAFTQYKKGKGCSFTTLTYTPENTPIAGNGKVTLRKEDLQKYFKRCRKWLNDKKVPLNFKYVACGEMGGMHGLPHYHIIFLGLDSATAGEMTRHTWREGITQTKTLKSPMIRYTLKYIEKQVPYKQRKEQLEKWGYQNPFILRSKGIGAELYKKLGEENQYIDGKMLIAPKYWKQKYGIEQNVMDLIYRQYEHDKNLCKREKLQLWHYLKDCKLAREYKAYMQTILNGQPAKNINKGEGMKVQIGSMADKALKDI